MTIEEGEKECTKCKEVKKTQSFNRDKQKSDGLTSWCKRCRRVLAIDYSIQNRERIRQTSKRHYNKRREYTHQYLRKRYSELKKELTLLLGSKCARCGFEDKRVLQIDHINGGGRKHFKQAGGAYTMFREMIKSVKSKENKYQLLCSNCNLIEAFEKGYKKTIWT